MDDPAAPHGPGDDAPNPDGRHDHRTEEWVEAMARTVGHLAAQLTLAQIRLRALATELQERGVVAPAEVAARVRAIAAAETGGYLRENLGEALVEVIDVEALERDLIAYLSDPENA
jgi:hypothetical protein